MNPREEYEMREMEKYHDAQLRQVYLYKERRNRINIVLNVFLILFIVLGLVWMAR